MVSKIEVDTVVNQSGDQDSGLDLSTNDVVAVKTANTERMRVDASGNVILNATSQGGTSHKLCVKTDNKFGVSIIDTTAQAANVGGALNLGGNYRSSGDAQAFTRIEAKKVNGNDNDYGYAMSFSTTPNSGTFTERMRITSDGSISLGHGSDPTADASVGVSVNTNSANDTIHTLTNNTATNTSSSTAREHQTFRRAGTQVGGITTASSSTSFNTSSDYRIKENVNYSFDATTDLKKLKPCKFNFKDISSETIVGFLAHEAAEVVPNSVVGEKDAVDSQGAIKPQSIDHSKLVPLLVKTIQELEARIVALESK